MDPATEIQQLKFLMNTQTNEIKFVKQQFGPMRIKQIDKTDANLKHALFEIEILKTNLETVALQSDLDNLRDRMRDYAPIQTIKDLKKDIADLVKVEDFRVLEKELMFIKKDGARQITKEEVDERLSVMHNELMA